LAIVSLDFQI